MQGRPAIILFDGVCNLCSASVQFIIRRDPRGLFRFAALQSDAARSLLAECGVRGPLPDSLMLIEGGRCYARSAAALRIVRRLRLPWPVLYALVAVPRPIRDWAYDFLARHRYRWFGRREACMAPTPELRDRFIEWYQARS